MSERVAARPGPSCHWRGHLSGLLTTYVGLVDLHGPRQQLPAGSYGQPPSGAVFVTVGVASAVPRSFVFGSPKAGGAFVFMAASLLAAGLLMFLVRRPRAARASQQPRRHPAARAADALASASGASPDPLYGQPTSALLSGRHKTH